MSYGVPVHNGQKKGNALSPLHFNFSLEHCMRTDQANQEGLKLNGTHQLLVFADDVNVLGKNISWSRSNTQETEYMFILITRMQDKIVT
jgi:hypothetical protein